MRSERQRTSGLCGQHFLIGGARRNLFAKIAALFREIKSAISLFLSRFAELFNSAFLLHFLEIADFIFELFNFLFPN